MAALRPCSRAPWRQEGADADSEALADAPATRDLQAARSPGFVPQRDGSLQLIRPTGLLEAAEEVAAALAALPYLQGVVLIGADSLLDTALRRPDLPTTGARPRPEDNALSQVLPLTLALGWWPCDPHRALELLTLPMSPVPRGIAHRLAEALHERPAVGSDAWDTALSAGLAAVPEEAASGSSSASPCASTHPCGAPTTPSPRSAGAWSCFSTGCAGT